MPRKPDERIERARQLFQQGRKLVDIAKQLDLPEGTVRSWKNRYKWDRNVANKECNVAERKRGGQPGNKNATGPPGNKNAEKYGFFSKYLPDETREIFSAIEQADPLDLLWHQIQIAYAAIIRAQRIAYVKNQDDKTIEKIEEKKGKITGERWEVQQAWDKQNEFMKAQARAQSELRSLIRQYDELLHRDWDLTTDEQRARINQLRAQTQKITGEGMEVEDMSEIESEIYGEGQKEENP